jgi:hypothetical protein
MTMTYKAFCDTVLAGIKAGSWTFDQLWGNTPGGQRVWDFIEEVGDAKYQRFMVRMDKEGKFKQVEAK